LTYNKATMGN